MRELSLARRRRRNERRQASARSSRRSARFAARPDATTFEAMYRGEVPASPFVLLTVSASQIEAVDRRSGRTVWSFAAASINATTAAIRCAIEGNRAVVVASSDVKGAWSADVLAVVSCLDLATGALLWQQTFDPEVNAGLFAATVVVDAGQVLVSVATTLVAFGLADGLQQWSRRLEAPLRAASGAAALILPWRASLADRR